MDDPSVRQRLIAILCADAAGFSRLMAGDEHATLAALDAARELFRARIESNHGRVIDMAGDSILAVFETATGAVSAAIAIQQDLAQAATDTASRPRMPFRIGVHLGDVIEKQDGTVYGDGVNVAARLQALAEPGGIVVSDAVRGAVGSRVDASFADKGEQPLKNIARPIHAFAVRPGRDTDAPAAAPPPRASPRPSGVFVGRRAELAQLQG
ncbi:MAG TPA: adenylate/guanylate cyclase domain-containing protein, partial [Variovorax sp.]|nr:adenylate/guanylate cyclase domain-containing protein [Variovorax sp.]